MVFMLVVPFAAGAVAAFPTAASADDSSCNTYSFYNSYLHKTVDVPSGTLVEGSTGACVADLQQGLYDIGYKSLAIDGQFGPMTRAAVVSFQEQNLGCTGGADGEAGHYTMSCLIGGTG